MIDRLQRLLRSTTEDQQGILFGKPRDGGTEVLGSRPLVTFTTGEIAAAIGKTGDSAVGYYRIREGTSLELTSEETGIAAELFSNRGSVVLLIERRPGQAEGCFFFQESGALLNYPLLTFPVDSAELARLEARRLLRAEENSREPSAAVSPASPPIDAAPAAARVETVPVEQSAAAASTVALPFARWRNLALLLGGASAGFCAFLLIDVARRRAVPSGTAATVPVAPGTPLKAERQGTDLKITWDLNSSAIASATSGLLNIDDGGVKRQLALTPEQVRYGGLLYSPTSDHVSVRLTTLKGNQSTSDAYVIVLLNRESSPALPGSGSAPKAPLRSENRTDSKATAPASVPTAQPGDPEGAPSRFASERGNDSRAAARPFVPPTAVVRTAPSVAPQELPTVAAALPHVDAPVLPVGSPAPPRPAERPKVAAQQPTPAVLIYDPGVSVPPELKQIINAPVNVRVRVAVDAAGRVTRAEGVREDRVHALLLSAATDAALRCRFRPARLGDTPVASEVTINFKVRP